MKLSNTELAQLAEVFLDHAGLAFNEASKLSVERRLTERVEELGLAGFSDYVRYLRTSSNRHAETTLALELLTTAETYFMRQNYQFHSFQAEVLPELARRNRESRRLVVWSAGCSTGEEAISLAILIQASGLFRGWTVRVLGTDLSRTRVATARRGVYRERSFKAVDEQFRKDHFVRCEEGWQVCDELRALCQFSQVNLMDPLAVSSVGRVDAVFCRNVLIYMAPAARAAVTQQLFQRLVPGGYLFLGHSESLLNVDTTFEVVHLSEDLAYQKPLLAKRSTEELP